MTTTVPTHRRHHINLNILHTNNDVNLNLNTMLLVNFTSNIPIRPTTSLPNRTIRYILIPTRVIHQTINVPFPLFLFHLILSPCNVGWRIILLSFTKRLGSTPLLKRLTTPRHELENFISGLSNRAPIFESQRALSTPATTTIHQPTGHSPED